MKNLKAKRWFAGLAAAALIGGGVAMGAGNGPTGGVQAQAQPATMAPCPCWYGGQGGQQAQAQQQPRTWGPNANWNCPMRGRAAQAQGWPCGCRRNRR